VPRLRASQDYSAETHECVPPLDDPLSDLRLGDVLALLSVRRCGSLSGAARERQVTPSQISRAVARLEKQLRSQLLSRGARGAQFTESGERVLPQLEEVVAQLRYLRRNEQRPSEELTIAGPSFLCSAFLPCLADCVPGLRVRGMEMAPALLRAAAPDGVFDVALILGRERLPDTWHSARVGELRKGLFAMPKLAARLGASPVPPETLATLPFINPVYNADGRLVPTDDSCPLHHGVRVPGHEVQTFSLGLELALSTGQLVFGPVLAARRYVERGLLVEVSVQGWDVRESLYVAHHGDRVKAKHQRAMLGALTARLRELSEPPRPWAPVATSSRRRRS
jgi:DNA-binding transcriptional LysR family regulator